MVGIRGAQIPTLAVAALPDLATLAYDKPVSPEANARHKAFRCLESPVYDEAFGASKEFLVLGAPASPPPQRAVKRKLSGWRINLKAQKEQPTQRPESFRCSTAAAVEEAYAAPRDRYQVACVPHDSFQVPKAYDALDAMEKSPMSEALLQRAYDRQRTDPKRSELAYLRSPNSFKRQAAMLADAPPIPSLPEEFESPRKTTSSP